MSLDLQAIMDDLGVTIVREVGNELVGFCPMHKERVGKEDSHPSWSINQDTFLHHCFSCGYSGGLNGLYIDLKGELPDNLEWEIRKTSLLNKPVLPQDKPVKVNEDDPIVSEWQLRHYDPVPSSLLERRYLSDSSAALYEVKWDRERRCWVLPIRSVDGELVGYQFRQKGVERNYPSALEKSNYIFGAHLWLAESRITVVESPLDAVRLHSVGIPAVSTMGAYVSEAQATILFRNWRFVVAAMDNDAPGCKSVEYLLNLGMKRGTLVVPMNYEGLPGKDPGDVKSDSDLRAAWDRSVRMGV